MCTTDISAQVRSRAKDPRQGARFNLPILRSATMFYQVLPIIVASIVFGSGYIVAALSPESGAENYPDAEV